MSLSFRRVKGVFVSHGRRKRMVHGIGEPSVFDGNGPGLVVRERKHATFAAVVQGIGVSVASACPQGGKQRVGTELLGLNGTVDAFDFAGCDIHTIRRPKQAKEGGYVSRPMEVSFHEVAG